MKLLLHWFTDQTDWPCVSVTATLNSAHYMTVASEGSSGEFTRELKEANKQTKSTQDETTMKMCRLNKNKTPEDAESDKFPVVVKLPCSSCLNMNVKLTMVIVALTMLCVQSSTSTRYTSPLPMITRSDMISCDVVFKWFPSKLPCLCSKASINSMSDAVTPINGTYVNCDHVTFFGDFPTLPSVVYSFSQRHSYIQSIEPQMFTLVPLKKLDLSYNNLRRLLDRTFDGIESSLLELDISYNSLGDQLNPIYACDELLRLKSLLSLDLSHNELKALDNNLFKGLRNLTVSSFNLSSFVFFAFFLSKLSHYFDRCTFVTLRRARCFSLASHCLNSLLFC